MTADAATANAADVTAPEQDGQGTRPGSDLAVPSSGFSSSQATPAKADLRITTVATPQRAETGDTIRFSITVDNRGNAPATGVLLTDATPAGTSYVQGSVRVDGQATPDGQIGDGNPLASSNTGVPLGTLAAGVTATVTFEAVVIAPAGTTIQNVAIVQSDGPEFRASLPAVVQVTGVAALSATTKASIGGPEGFTITWTTTVTNSGDSPTDVTYLDKVPAGASYLAGTITVDGVSRPDGSGDPLAGISLGTLAPGQTVVVAFKAMITSAPPGTALSNDARLSIAGGASAVVSSASIRFGTQGMPGVEGLAVTGASHLQLLLAGLACLALGGLLIRPDAARSAQHAAQERVLAHVAQHSGLRRRVLAAATSRRRQVVHRVVGKWLVVHRVIDGRVIDRRVIDRRANEASHAPVGVWIAQPSIGLLASSTLAPNSLDRGTPTRVALAASLMAARSPDLLAAQPLARSVRAGPVPRAGPPGSGAIADGRTRSHVTSLPIEHGHRSSPTAQLAGAMGHRGSSRPADGRPVGRAKPGSRTHRSRSSGRLRGRAVLAPS